MRKQTLFLVAVTVMLFVTSALFAQDWHLAGNSDATAASKLGTTNSMPLRLFTNNAERVRIDPSGKVGIGTITPAGKLTIFNNGSTPAGSWVTAGSPLLTAYGESTVGNGDFILSMASNIPSARGVFIGRKARGTLAAPSAVQTNDFLASMIASGYDGSAFQSPASIEFFVDGTPTSGNIPARISLVTGTNSLNRKERLKIGSTGNINFNNGQLYVQQSNGHVGIGTSSPSYKLHVDDTVGTAIYGESRSTFEGVGLGPAPGAGVVGIGSPGVRGESYTGVGVYAAGATYGLYGSAGDPESDIAIGVYGTGATYGVEGESNDGPGVYGKGSTGIDGYGSTYGVYGQGDYYAGYFNGDVYTTGSYQSSDRKLKQNIADVSSAIDIINKLQPKTYEYKQDGAYKLMHLPTGKHYGLIAQDLEQVLPTLVKETKFDTKLAQVEVKPERGKVVVPSAPLSSPTTSQTSEVVAFKAVNYTELIPILVKAIQEQQQHIQKQDALIDKQQQQIEELKTLVSKVSEGQTINTTVSSGVLGQNTPNPGNASTTIQYRIPQGLHRAQLVITDNLGRTIKAVQLTTSGIVNINTATLSNGTYNYSLVVDDKIIATKQMIIDR